MAQRDKQALVADIERQHGGRLRRFLAARLRTSLVPDAPDLAQEGFLRLLRIEHLETIRSSESHLFTVAFHVLHQHVMRHSAAPESVEFGAKALGTIAKASWCVSSGAPETAEPW